MGGMGNMQSMGSMGSEPKKEELGYMGKAWSYATSIKSTVGTAASQLGEATGLSAPAQKGIMSNTGQFGGTGFGNNGGPSSYAPPGGM